MNRRRTLDICPWPSTEFRDIFEAAEDVCSLLCSKEIRWGFTLRLPSSPQNEIAVHGDDHLGNSNGSQISVEGEFPETALLTAKGKGKI